MLLSMTAKVVIVFFRNNLAMEAGAVGSDFYRVVAR
jgi:hypothetical protein